MTEEWAHKEFVNLTLLKEAGLPCPQPITWEKNVLVMSMIGDNGEAAPTLKTYLTIHPKYAINCFKQCIDLLIDMFKKLQFVHADFSEYNLLYIIILSLLISSVYNKIVYIIDVGQSVTTQHPLWESFLKRDIHNILKFFENYISYHSLEDAEISLFEGIVNKSITSSEFLERNLIELLNVCYY